MIRTTPIIVILGSTATGKTKLSIDLAKRFGGEIISADSMQIYKGLDVSTAKATASEQSQATHHMLDVCDVTTKQFTVVDFRDATLPIIDRLLLRTKIPIIVGGTNYYIESLLWKVLVKPPPTNNSCNKSNDSDCEKSCSDSEAIGSPTILATYNRISVIDALKKLSPEKMKEADPLYLHKLLTTIDPVTAQGLHPNDTRKVRRALEVFLDAGVPMSAILDQQKNESGGSYLGGPLRYDHVILFWLKSDQKKLNTRIDARIDGMIAQGMLFEVRKCYNILKAEPIDCTRGMMQSIGFKEFLPYLEKYQDDRLDTEITDFIRSHGGVSGKKTSVAHCTTPDGLELLEECLDNLRLHTKQYSKKQIKWVRNRIVSSKGRLVPPIYELNASLAETNWHEDVYSKAENVVQSYIDNVESDLKPIESMRHPTADMNANITHFCEACDKRLIGDFQWNVHLQSQKHRKVVQKQKKELAKKAIANRNGLRSIFDSIRANFIIFWRQIFSFRR